MKRFLIISLLLLLALPIVSAYDIGYPWAGTYNWTCPADNYTMFLNMAGAGGSGKSTTWLAAGGGWNEWGYGGSAGQYGNVTMVSVVPGTIYSVVVGAKGAQSAAYDVSYAGGSSYFGPYGSAATYTKSGGAGGLAGGYGSNADGGVGGSTNYLPSVCVIPPGGGGSVIGGTGGLGGTGCGAGGGGAATNTSRDYGVPAAIGGAGSDGYVGIWDMNASGTNIPAYTASPTSTGYGNVVTFTDESILNDDVGLTYLWDFGDTLTSTTRGSTTHVYATYGVFTTNLTLASSTGTVYLNKTNYITITNVPITAWYSPKLVKFKIVDAYGSDLPGANISISYITNSLPNKDPAYLTSAFGIPQSVALQMTTDGVAMQGYTGTDGSASFTLFPAIQYGITITNASAGLTNYVTLYPQDNDYVIRCPLTTQVMPTMAGDSLVNSSLFVTEPNSSWITWNLLYSDPSGHTTGLTWNVTCWNNMTVMHSNTWGAVGTSTVIVDNYTFPSEPKGMEYVAMYDAIRDVP